MMKLIASATIDALGDQAIGFPVEVDYGRERWVTE
jgi:hypothetical protein